MPVSQELEDARMYNFLYLVVKAYALAKTIFEGRQVSLQTILMLAKAELVKVAPEFRDLMMFLRLYQSAYLVLQQERDGQRASGPQSSNASEHAQVQATVAAAQIPTAVSSTASTVPTPAQGRNGASPSARYHPYNSGARPQRPQPSQQRINESAPGPSQPRPNVARVTPAPTSVRPQTPAMQNISQNGRKRKADSSWASGAPTSAPQQTPSQAVIQNGAKQRAGSAMRPTGAPVSVPHPASSKSIVQNGGKRQANAMASTSSAPVKMHPQAPPQMLSDKNGKRKADPSWDNGRDAKRPNSRILSEVACCWAPVDREGKEVRCGLIPSDRDSIQRHLKTVHKFTRGYIYCKWGECTSQACLTMSNIADHICAVHLGGGGAVREDARRVGGAV